jgi:hypothetical protein
VGFLSLFCDVDESICAVVDGYIRNMLSNI